MRIKTDDFLGEFEEGMKRALKEDDPSTHAKAVRAVASRRTTAANRAYWTGYICQLQGPSRELPTDFGNG